MRWRVSQHSYREQLGQLVNEPLDMLPFSPGTHSRLVLQTRGRAHAAIPSSATRGDMGI